MRRALEEPIRQIVENAGLEGRVIVEKVKAETWPPAAATPRAGEYVDMIKAGIIDPTKVERVALQNAASRRGLVAHHRGVIAELPEDKPAGAPPKPHGDF